jgi:hypothetical protein
VTSSDAHAVLAAAGALLRRGDERGAHVDGVDERAVGFFLASVYPDVEARRLERAIDDAFEATIATTSEERAMFEAAAMAGLQARDRLESSFAAIEAYVESRGAVAKPTRRTLDDLRAAIARSDARLRKKVTSLVGVNDARRRERDALAEEHRDEAWWWSERAECDVLARVLRGEPIADEGHFAWCAECSSERRLARLVDSASARHVSSDDLWRFDTGQISRDGARRIGRHTDTCASCRLAIVAMRDADAAIELDAGDVVKRHPAFRVVALRGATETRLVVEPREGARISSVKLSGPTSKAEKTARGFELAVAAKRVSAATLIVAFEAGARVTVDVDLRKPLA